MHIATHTLDTLIEFNIEHISCYFVKHSVFSIYTWSWSVYWKKICLSEATLAIKLLYQVMPTEFAYFGVQKTINSDARQKGQSQAQIDF